MRTIRRLTLPLAALLIAVPAAAEILAYDFREYQDVTVGVPWVDQGLTFAITSNGTNDVAISHRQGLVMGQVILTLDLAPLNDVRTIDVQIYTSSLFTPTRVGIFSDSELIQEISSGEPYQRETLTVDAAGATARWLRITSDNSRLEDLVIHHGVVAGESSAWSDVKRLYR